MSQLTNQTMKFTVELIYKNKEIKYIFNAINLEQLDDMIEKRYPKCKVISIFGGG